MKTIYQMQQDQQGSVVFEPSLLFPPSFSRLRKVEIALQMSTAKDSMFLILPPGLPR